MKRLNLFLIIILIFTFSSIAFADKCIDGVCNLIGHTYVSTRAYNLTQTGGNMGYGAWSNVTSKTNDTSLSYNWNQVIYLKEDIVIHSSGMKSYFNRTDSYGSTRSESVQITIPPRYKAFIDKRSCTQYTYYKYDIKCEFWDAENDVFRYVSHATNESGDMRNSWEEHRFYMSAIY